METIITLTIIFVFFGIIVFFFLRALNDRPEKTDEEIFDKINELKRKLDFIRRIEVAKVCNHFFLIDSIDKDYNHYYRCRLCGFPEEELIKNKLIKGR